MVIFNGKGPSHVVKKRMTGIEVKPYFAKFVSMLTVYFMEKFDNFSGFLNDAEMLTLA